jgi:hypothetical protein
MSTRKEIYDHLNKYINTKSGSKPNDWYVGIASDPRSRLFNDHQVNETIDTWAYAYAETNDIAREIEKAYHDAGYDGGPGGGDATTKAVYAYFKTSSTKE